MIWNPFARCLRNRQRRQLVAAKPGGDTVDLQRSHLEKLIQTGEHEKAFALLDNVVARNPGDAHAIQIYEESVNRLIDDDQRTGRPQDAVKKLRWLSSFLRDSSRFVQPALVGELIDRAGKLDARVAEFEHKSESKKQSVPVRLKPVQDLVSLGKQPTNRTVELLQKISAALSSAIPESPEYSALKTMHQTVASAIAFDGVLATVDAMILSANERANLRIGGYLLQNCEARLREAANLLTDLENEYETALAQKLEELKTASAAIERKTTETKAEAFLDELKKDPSGLLAKLDGGGQSTFTERIAAGIELVTAISQRIIRDFNGNPPESCRDFAEQIQEKIRECEISRQKAYGDWALERIEEGYNKAQKFVGKVYDDKEDLSNEIISTFSPIDSILLPQPVARAHTECFEYLISKMKIPSGEEAFESKKSKLYVLKTLAKKEKRAIDSF